MRTHGKQKLTISEAREMRVTLTPSAVVLRPIDQESGSRVVDQSQCKVKQLK